MALTTRIIVTPMDDQDYTNVHMYVHALTLTDMVNHWQHTPALDIPHLTTIVQWGRHYRTALSKYCTVFSDSCCQYKLCSLFKVPILLTDFVIYYSTVSTCENMLMYMYTIIHWVYMYIKCVYSIFSCAFIYTLTWTNLSLE